MKVIIVFTLTCLLECNHLLLNFPSFFSNVISQQLYIERLRYIYSLFICFIVKIKILQINIYKNKHVLIYCLLMQFLLMHIFDIILQVSKHKTRFQRIPQSFKRSFISIVILLHAFHFMIILINYYKQRLSVLDLYSYYGCDYSTLPLSESIRQMEYKISHVVSTM